MASVTAADIPIPRLVPRLVPAQASTGVARRRRISPEAGHALEILGHAIDYLIDEYLNGSGAFSWSDPQLQAVQLLMALNREIYSACPLAPSLMDRLRSRFHRAQPQG